MDEDTKQEGSAEAPDQRSEEFMSSAPRDWFLAELVRLANLTDSRFPVTLTISGGIVSGLLISGREYFSHFADDFAKFGGDDPGHVASLREYISSYGSVYESDKEDETTDDTERLRAPQFVHLASARFFAPGQTPIPTNAGVLWRGNLDGISGFSLGAFAVAEQG
jgi:hypothetical protein